MSQTPSIAENTARPAAATPPRPSPHIWVPFSAIWALFTLSLERVARGNRLLVLGLLFLLPTVITLIARYYNDVDARFAAEGQEALVFYLITNALIPFSALVLASGLIQDEVEEQTLTYLLVRPLPKWLIYLAKLAAVIVIAASLASVFTMLTLAALHYGTEGFSGQVFPGQAIRISALLALASATYCALFGAVSLILRRSMIISVAYIILFEGIFANIDFVVRKATVMYYTRVLAERWLGIHVESWSINLDYAPSGWNCLLILLGAILISTIAAAFLFTVREFRLKTPEGS